MCRDRRIWSNSQTVYHFTVIAWWQRFVFSTEKDEPFVDRSIFFPLSVSWSQFMSTFLFITRVTGREKSEGTFDFSFFIRVFPTYSMQGLQIPYEDSMSTGKQRQSKCFVIFSRKALGFWPFFEDLAFVFRCLRLRDLVTRKQTTSSVQVNYPHTIEVFINIHTWLSVS